MRPARARELDGEALRPRRPRRDQHPLAGGEPAVVEEPLPGAEARERDRRAFDMAQRPRLRSQELAGNDGVLGGGPVPPEVAEGEDLVSGRNALARRDDAGELVRRNRGQPLGRPFELVARDRGRVHARTSASPGPGRGVSTSS